jgi:hypothetical protein
VVHSRLLQLLQLKTQAHIDAGSGMKLSFELMSGPSYAVALLQEALCCGRPLTRRQAVTVSNSNQLLPYAMSASSRSLFKSCLFESDQSRLWRGAAEISWKGARCRVLHLGIGTTSTEGLDASQSIVTGFLW